MGTVAPVPLMSLRLPGLRATTVAWRVRFPQPEAPTVTQPHFQDRSTQTDDSYSDHLSLRLRGFLAELLHSSVDRPLESVLQEAHSMFPELPRPLQESMVQAFFDIRLQQRREAEQAKQEEEAEYARMIKELDDWLKPASAASSPAPSSVNASE